MSEFAEKVRTIAAPRKLGSSRTIVVQDERDGSVAGKQTEHWDDHVDAVAMPKPVQVKVKQEG